MSFPRPVKAVVFDMDGLLVDTEQVVFAAMRHAAAGIGRDLPFAIFQRMVGLTHAKSDLILAEHFGDGFDLEGFQAAVSTYFRAEQAAGIALKAGVVEILDRLDAMALPRAIATSSSRYAVEQSLGPHGLLDRFEFLACREDVPLPKPAPDLYKLVLTHFGLRGHEAIAFEDSNTGSLAAKRANLWAVACPNPSTAHHDFKHVDLKVASLAEAKLVELIKKFGR